MGTTPDDTQAAQPEMPADTVVPGEIVLAVSAARHEFAHALGRRLRSGEQVLPADQVAGLAHMIGQLVQALDEKSRRVTELEEAAEAAAELLQQHEESARALVSAVANARRDLEAARGDGW